MENIQCANVGTMTFVDNPELLESLKVCTSFEDVHAKLSEWYPGISPDETLQVLTYLFQNDQMLDDVDLECLACGTVTVESSTNRITIKN